MGGAGGCPPNNFENDAELVKSTWFVGQIFSIISLNLDKIDQILIRIDQIWSELTKFGHIWPYLVKFNQVDLKM